MKYDTGEELVAGDVVMADNRPQRYLVVGIGGSTVTILSIGTVIDEKSPIFGETIVQGFTRDVPPSALTKIGSARITVAES
jgi:hypothetical protein